MNEWMNGQTDNMDKQRVFYKRGLKFAWRLRWLENAIEVAWIKGSAAANPLKSPLGMRIKFSSQR
jgi:hypothetical protein